MILYLMPKKQLVSIFLSLKYYQDNDKNTNCYEKKKRFVIKARIKRALAAPGGSLLSSYKPNLKQSRDK